MSTFTFQDDAPCDADDGLAVEAWSLDEVDVLAALDSANATWSIADDLAG